MRPELAYPEVGHEMDPIRRLKTFGQCRPFGDEVNVMLLPERTKVEQLAKVTAA